MVRMQIVIGILALAVSALGCGDDDNGSAGTAGTGGMAGTGGGGLTNACNEEPDFSAATSPEFAGQFWGCYDTAGMDLVLSVTSCLEETPGLSNDCADCYGDYAECIDTSCGESCNERGADTQPCTECLAAECNLALTSCSAVGFPAVVPE